jgi:hypothetical protein
VRGKIDAGREDFVAGLFDVPDTESPVPALVSVADWSRVRILLDGGPLLAREGRSAGIRIAGRTVETTLVEGEPMETRIAATTRRLTEDATLQVSLGSGRQ